MPYRQLADLQPCHIPSYLSLLAIEISLIEEYML
jgi:hypothetical protein